MRKYKFNKLIRNKITSRMHDEGVLVNSKNLSEQEYLAQLNSKLIEEANEVIESQTKDELTTELADLIEVINTIADANQISPQDIEDARVKKREINGHFCPDHYIDYIEVAEDNHKVIEYLENKNRPYILV